MSMTKTHNFIYGGCRLVSIRDEQGNCIYQEESTGSESEKPLYVQPGKETNELVEEIYSDLESKAWELNQTPIHCNILNKQVEIHSNIDLTQFDNSTISKISGTNGAYCNRCELTAEEANQRANIVAGFPITRTVERTRQKYEELLQHRVVRRGEPFIKIPSETRKGVTHKPMGQGNIFYPTILHP